MNQPRSSQRYVRKPADDEGKLLDEIYKLVRKHPSSGYRPITKRLRQKGWGVNFKRVYRLWRQEGLKAPKNKRKKRRLGISKNGCERRRSEHPNDVWCWDFIYDRTENGRLLKWLSIIDEFTRECLCLEVSNSITSEDVIEKLSELFRHRRIPNHIRSDNGPEFVSKSLQVWLEKIDVGPLYIAPGSPWQNGYAESFHSRLRDEFLSLEEFENLQVAKKLTELWQVDYNEHRPHSSLGYQTPKEFFENWSVSIPVAAQPPLQQTNHS